MRFPKIAVFSGCLQIGSANARLAQSVAQHLATLDAHPLLVALDDYPMPLYRHQIEEQADIPRTVRALHRLLIAHDGVFVASPEYNASMAPVLKNVLDWLACASKITGHNLFAGRFFALGSAASAPSGGMNGLVHLRTVLEIGLGAFVLPQMVMVGDASRAFAVDGRLADAHAAHSVHQLAVSLVGAARRMMPFPGSGADMGAGIGEGEICAERYRSAPEMEGTSR